MNCVRKPQLWTEREFIFTHEYFIPPLFSAGTYCCYRAKYFCLSNVQMFTSSQDGQWCQEMENDPNYEGTCNPSVEVKTFSQFNRSSLKGQFLTGSHFKSFESGIKLFYRGSRRLAEENKLHFFYFHTYFLNNESVICLLLADR